MSVSHLVPSSTNSFVCPLVCTSSLQVKSVLSITPGYVLTAADSVGNAFWASGGGGISYSTGSWTPQLLFNESSLGIEYATPPVGTYTQIGNVVTISGHLELSALGDFAEDAIPTIAGLPFVVSGSSVQSNLSCSWSTFNLDPNSVYISAHPTPGTSIITPTSGYRTGSPEIALYFLFWTGGCKLNFSGQYFTGF